MLAGIGGIFSGKKTKLLAVQYEKHFGISQVGETDDQEPWQQEGEPTVCAPFEETTDYCGRREQMWMLNFRVQQPRLD